MLETPLVNVTAVVEPKLVATAALLVTVGAVTGLVELEAPVNVLEQTAHPGHHHVTSTELGLGVPRLEDPG